MAGWLGGYDQTKDSNVQKMREFNEEGCVGVFTLFMLVQVSCSLIKMMMSRELPVLITFYLHFRLTSFWSRLKLNICPRVKPCDGAMEEEKKNIYLSVIDYKPGKNSV